MIREENIRFYVEQIDFAKGQVEWYSDQIKWYGKNIKSETYDFGLSLEGKKMKNERNKCYKERSYWRHKIKAYENKLALTNVDIYAI